MKTIDESILTSMHGQQCTLEKLKRVKVGGEYCHYAKRIGRSSVHTVSLLTVRYFTSNENLQI